MVSSQAIWVSKYSFVVYQKSPRWISPSILSSQRLKSTMLCVQKTNPLQRDELPREIGLSHVGRIHTERRCTCRDVHVHAYFTYGANVHACCRSCTHAQTHTHSHKHTHEKDISYLIILYIVKILPILQIVQIQIGCATGTSNMSIVCCHVCGEITNFTRSQLDVMANCFNLQL